MSAGAKLSRTEREDYLIRLKKEFAFAGAAVPERLRIDGRDVPLRAFVLAIAGRKGGVPPADLAEADRIAAAARRRRAAIVEEVGTADLSRDEADRLFEEAVGLSRALDTLDRAREPRSSVAEEARKARLEDGRRWLGLVSRVYGKEKKGRDRFQ